MATESSRALSICAPGERERDEFTTRTAKRLRVIRATFAPVCGLPPHFDMWSLFFTSFGLRSAVPENDIGYWRWDSWQPGLHLIVTLKLVRIGVVYVQHSPV